MLINISQAKFLEQVTFFLLWLGGYIQGPLGHKSRKTTDIYTHISNKDLNRIKSPLDLIMSKVLKNEGK